LESKVISRCRQKEPTVSAKNPLSKYWHEFTITLSYPVMVELIASIVWMIGSMHARMYELDVQWDMPHALRFHVQAMAQM
jgi:hypothetical protein